MRGEQGVAVTFTEQSSAAPSSFHTEAQPLTVQEGFRGDEEGGGAHPEQRDQLQEPEAEEAEQRSLVRASTLNTGTEEEEEPARLRVTGGPSGSEWVTPADPLPRRTHRAVTFAKDPGTFYRNTDEQIYSSLSNPNPSYVTALIVGTGTTQSFK